MPINASIPLGVQPLQLPQQDPNQGLNALARMMQLRGMQDEQQVNSLKMQEMQRGVEDKNYLRNALSAPDADPYKIMLGRGMLSEANAFRKNQVDSDKATAQAEKDRFDMARQRVDSWGQAMGYVRSNPTPENAVAAVKHLVTLGVMPPAMAQQALAGVTQDPQSISQWATQGFQAALSAKDQLPKYDSRNLGGSTQMTATDPVTGRVNVVNSVQNTQSPDNRASVAAQMENASATREVAQATRDAATIQTGFKNEQELRKEFEGLPEVKNYKQAYPAFAAIKDAASRNTTQSDINIVYGLAKLYDPTSVVREGEYATVANSPNIPERVKGYAQYLQGGGKLSPETKNQILAEAQGRIGTYEAEARKAKGSFEQIAKTRGMNPGAVFADMGDLTAAPAGGGGGGGKPPTAGPKPGAVQDGYRFKGGNPADPKSWEKI